MQNDKLEFNSNKMSVKPNLDAYVFLKVRKDVRGVLIEDATGEGRWASQQGNSLFNPVYIRFEPYEVQGKIFPVVNNGIWYIYFHIVSLLEQICYVV